MKTEKNSKLLKSGLAKNTILTLTGLLLVSKKQERKDYDIINKPKEESISGKSILKPISVMSSSKTHSEIRTKPYFKKSILF